jgi:hypothetical protein
MLSIEERQEKVLKGEIVGTVIPPSDRLLKNQRYWDRKNLSREEFTLKWSPFHNVHLRMNDEQIAQFRHDAKLFADMFNANYRPYKELMK